MINSSVGDSDLQPRSVKYEQAQVATVNLLKRKGSYLGLIKFLRTNQIKFRIASCGLTY